MKKMWKFALAAVLATAAFLSMPPKAHASIYCNLCDQYHTCFDCCRCDGGGSVYCTKNCP